MEAKSKFGEWERTWEQRKRKKSGEENAQFWDNAMGDEFLMNFTER